MLKKIITILCIFYTAVLYSDVDNYYSSTNNDGYSVLVERNVLKRPFTYLMVDEWTEGKWTWNPTKTERWFVSYGLVNKKTEFFNIIDRHIPDKLGV
jgi:hypothetical protein